MVSVQDGFDRLAFCVKGILYTVMRVNKIDFLRFVGLAMIILAHVGPHDLLFQLRNFDVPLMVLVSGMSFGIAFKNESYRTYLWKRVKRLLFPVWIFLTIYFTALYILNPISDDLTLNKIATSYFLISGIGYVWIIRVFLLVALVSPLIYQLHRNTPSDKRYLFMLLTALVIYELFRYVAMPYISVGSYQLLTMVIYYIVPYSLLFAFGLRIPLLSNHITKKLLWLSVTCFVAIGGVLWTQSGNFVPTQAYKYPPSIYYFSYAIAVSLVIWLVGDVIWSALEKNRYIKGGILFIAQNSIWIYLWHIPLVKHIQAGVTVKYLLVFTAAALITYFQVWFVNNILIKRTSSNTLKRNFKMLLTG